MGLPPEASFEAIIYIFHPCYQGLGKAWWLWRSFCDERWGEGVWVTTQDYKPLSDGFHNTDFAVVALIYDIIQSDTARKLHNACRAPHTNVAPSSIHLSPARCARGRQEPSALQGHCD